MSAPLAEDSLPPPMEAPTFEIPAWNVNREPVEMTQLRTGESFLDGVRRIAERQGTNPVAAAAASILPGMRVADDQVGIILNNGAITFRPPGAYTTTAINPWRTTGAVVPIRRTAGVEFDPLLEAARINSRLASLQLGQFFRQIVLQKQQVACFESQTSTMLVSEGTYVYSADVSMRGVIDLNRMDPVVVERETEDTAAVVSTADKKHATRIDHHGRTVPANQGHGTTVETTTRYLPAGYTKTVAGYTIARPEKGFVVMHKDAKNRISMTEGICMSTGQEDFVRCTKVQERNNGHRINLQDLEIEFGDLNHYAKSTPMLELKSKDNLDALCRAQIKWRQFRPDIWVSHRGAFTDPFDMLEEKCANMMRDWLLSVPYADALEEKAQGFTKVEHQWSSELNDTGRQYGVQVLNIEITTLRFPHIDKQDEHMALQLAETNLALETTRQNALKEKEMSKLNQATHMRMQEDRDREAEAHERQQAVEQRKNMAHAETETKKAEMHARVVQAEMDLAMQRQQKEKELQLAQAEAAAEAERVRAKGQRDAAQLAAEGEIAATKEKNKAQLQFLQQQAALLRDNPGLVELLQLQNDLLKTEKMAEAAKTNPNVVLLTGQAGLEARRMNAGHAPQVPGAVLTAD